MDAFYLDQTQENDFNDDYHQYLFGGDMSATYQRSPTSPKEDVQDNNWSNNQTPSSVKPVRASVSAATNRYNSEFFEDINAYLSQPHSRASDSDCYEYFTTRYSSHIPRPISPAVNKYIDNNNQNHHRDTRSKYMDRGGVKSSGVAKRKPAGGVGAIDEDTFVQSFDQVTRITLYSSKDLTDVMTKIKDVLSNHNEDWEKRVDHIRMLRAVVIAGGQDYDEFVQLLRYLEIPIQSSISDLRSLVVREACITVAYLSQELRNRFEHFAEVVMPNLISLLANSAKIMSTSGFVAIKFIMRNTSSVRIIPVVIGGMNTKSSVTRRQMSETLEIMCADWPTHVLERHLPLLQDVIKKGISDADQETRAVSRRVFVNFATHFKSQSKALLQSLDDSKRKMIEKEMGTAGITSSTGTTSVRNGGTAASTRSQSTERNAARRPGAVPSSRIAPATRKPSITSDGRTRTLSGQNQENDSTDNGRGRTPTKRYGVSQSTPTSREVSPSRSGYAIPPGNSGYGGYAGSATPGPERRGMARSRIPRSQGASREGSPSRGGQPSAVYSSVSRRTPGRSSLRNRTGGYAQRVLSQDKESEIALADALSRPQISRRFDQYDSDDNASETSSVCSETSYRSAGPFRGSDRNLHVKLSENIQEILNQLKSTQWGDRKDGLLNFQNYLRSGQTLNSYELKKVTEIFNKMFHDPHSKVVAMYMESLQLFIQVYHEHLSEWLYMILVRLLTKQGNEMLSSQQKRIRETLDVVRSTFPLELQFQYSCKFIIDSTQTPSVKVKSCLLEYMKDLMYYVSPEVLHNPNNDMRMAVSRIISWTTEPKSAEVRKLASRLVISLFDLNTSGFMNILQSMPRSFQEAATKVLHTTLETTGNGGHGRPSHASSTGRLSVSRSNSLRRRVSNPLPPNTRTSGLPGDLGAESISPEDINTFIRQTTEDIQSLSYNYDRVDAPSSSSSHQDGQHRTTGAGGHGSGYRYQGGHGSVNTSDKRSGGDRDAHSTDSGIQNSYTDLRGDVMDNSGGKGDFMPLGGRRYNPTCYDGQMAQRFGAPINDYHDPDVGGSRQSKPVIGYQTLKRIRETPPEDVMAEILQELSNHNERHEQRITCMVRLIKFLRESGVPEESWEEHFKPTLLILLETMGDNQAETRGFALKVLQELLRAQPNRFTEYVELTILKVLEAHKDPEKQVSRAAEDCAQVLASTLNAEQCLRVLVPIVVNSEDAICLAAIKIESQVVRDAEVSLIQRFAAEIVPGLIKGCDHRESSIRKACVFCLVSLHTKIGELIWIHLKDLSNSKLRLLHLYIQRAKENSESKHVGNAPT